jgi:ABC-type sugar transport system ATPase subunit
MNLWRGVCARAGGQRWQVTSPAFSVEGERDQVQLPDGSPVIIGVRPHDLDLAAPGSGDGLGRVEVVEPLGPATLIHVRVDGPSGDLVRIVVPAEGRIAVAESAGFRVRRDRLHLFDAQTGQRLN